MSTTLFVALLCIAADNAHHPDAPPETAQYGRLIGVWAVDNFIIQSDGTWPVEPVKARWEFRYILDGFAIQDDWVEPWPDEPAEGETRHYGTNIRIYNPAKAQWEMAWISSKEQQLSTFTAKEIDGNLVMRGRHATGNDARITFSNIADDAFDWTLDFAQPGGSWLTVAKMHATRLESHE
jgi:hypothetical protein